MQPQAQVIQCYVVTDATELTAINFDEEVPY
jgi:hypothetical protein